MKPLIGLLPLVDEERNSYWMLPEYMEAVEKSGGIPVMLPLMEEPETLRQMVQQFDGFLFTGGQDVSPWVYHAEPLEGKTVCCAARDRMETALLKILMEADKPVFGICRGLQLINAALGGSLYQDLPTEYASDVCHRQQPPYDQPQHRVTLIPGTPLEKLLQEETLEVNSRHHQAIRVLAPGLKEMAVSIDGLIEAFYLPEHRFFWAVQWHPEHAYTSSEESRKLFRAFINAAR